MTEHTDKRYEADLASLKAAILRMGDIVQEAVRKAVRSLMERDSALARQVVAEDDAVNALEMELHERCVELLARFQPAASDLRFIAIGLRIGTDLERMGDLAVNIAERAVALNAEPQLKPYVDIPQMAEVIHTMIQEALDALVRGDAEMARRVCAMDDEVDTLNERVHHDLVGIMQTDHGAISRGVQLLLVARHLERLGDHATNIAEEVVFMVQGVDIRHGVEKRHR